MYCEYYNYRVNNKHLYNSKEKNHDLKVNWSETNTSMYECVSMNPLRQPLYCMLFRNLCWAPAIAATTYSRHYV